MKTFDFLIVGSGFSGSITAMALVQSGYSVCLVEKNGHPRFAIGESSTPIADMILRDLADQYDLPFLKKLSRYGEWQKHYPGIICGLKRGFSYYQHKKGERFTSNKHHSRELLVAASENDFNSDTNWLRSDVDHFLVIKAVETGVSYFEQTDVDELSRDRKNEIWSSSLKISGVSKRISCRWIIDATGSPEFSSEFFGNSSSSRDFQTKSSAIFTHFESAKNWLEYLNQHDLKTLDYPFNPDFSALHHLIDEGWMWMLRFNNDLLSAGILLDEKNRQHSGKSPEEIWNSTIQQYPSLSELFKHSKRAESPGHFFKTGRLQRKLERVFGEGWIALPHSAGFVDPLHSTGIAHTLSGVENILNIFKREINQKEQKNLFKIYEDKIHKELELIDLMVSSSYKTRSNFKLFTASVMLYFIASIRYEQKRLGGEVPDTFLCAGDPQIIQLVRKTHLEFSKLNINSLTKSETGNFVDKIRKRIKPLNSAGLMNPELNNMYRHTAVAF